MTNPAVAVTVSDLEEEFFGRLLDMLTDSATANIFSDEDRCKVESRSRLPHSIGLFRGAFQAACDDLRVAREQRLQLESKFFEGLEGLVDLTRKRGEDFDSQPDPASGRGICASARKSQTAAPSTE